MNEMMNRLSKASRPSSSESKTMKAPGNPKILHRIYFDNFKPFFDPYDRYEESWRQQMPDYEIMKWNASNLDLESNEWVRRAVAAKSPVFLAEYFRWKVLQEYGGAYLDADCEILNGKVLHQIIDELHSQDKYDCFFGVEEASNGHPTAQTVGARKGSDLVAFMIDLYDNALPKLWEWRERRGLLGPSLMSLYFLDRGINTATDGFFKDLHAPVISARAKVYPQQYFSPKFSLTGDTLNYVEGQTCVYHMFANSNINFSNNKRMDKAQNSILTYKEYSESIAKQQSFPRKYDSSHFSTRDGRLGAETISNTKPDGLVAYGPYVSLPAGDYTVTFECPRIPSRGSISLRVTANHGAVTLGSRTALAQPAPLSPALTCDFVVPQGGSQNVEFVLNVSAIDGIEFSSATVSRKLATPATPQKKSLKIIHRVYFGFDGKEDRFLPYLKTWQDQLPDFKIMHWNASNLPMDINPFVRELYAEKDHAFLTDFFRWYLLREFGGVYFDADIEVVNGPLFRQLIEELEAEERFDAFIGIDEKVGGWYTAHSMASKPQSDLARFMCEVYDNFGKFSAWRKKGMYFWAPQLVGLYFASQGHNKAGMGTSPSMEAPKVIKRVKVYSQDWFSPLSPHGDPGRPFLLNGLSENTCVCHHFACTWHDESSPYVQRSRESGGQSNVMLKQLIEAEDRRIQQLASKEMYFSVEEGRLSTVVGVYANGTISCQGSAGCLVHGPYIDLAPGRYEVQFDLRNVISGGDLNVDVICDFGENCIYRGAVMIEGGSEPHLSFSLSADRVLHNVEFRLFSTKRSQFSVSGLRLRPNP